MGSKSRLRRVPPPYTYHPGSAASAAIRLIALSQAIQHARRHQRASDTITHRESPEVYPSHTHSRLSPPSARKVAPNRCRYTFQP
eukprot:4231837-Prymnesium_polylepis.1